MRQPNRKPPGRPDGGEYAPGPVDVPTASDIRVAPGDLLDDVASTPPAKVYEAYRERIVAAVHEGICPECRGNHHGLPHSVAMRKKRFINGFLEENRISFKLLDRESGKKIEAKLQFHSCERGAMLNILKRNECAVVRASSHIYIPYSQYNDGRAEHRPEMNDELDSVSLNGNYLVYRDDEGKLVVDGRDVQCTCLQYQSSGHCVHVDLNSAALQRHYSNVAKRWLSKKKLERDASKAAALTIYEDYSLGSSWTGDRTAVLEAAAMWRRDTPVLYSADSAAFRDDVSRARARKDQGLSPVPYMMGENVLDGNCQRGSGQAFGVEIEYESPRHWDMAAYKDALERVGRELYAAGLTFSPDQQIYHTASERGYTDAEPVDGVGNWSFETDGSCDGELVSPMLYDEPRTWEDIQKVVEILKWNGFTIGTHSGCHVHVGTPGYSISEYGEIARIVNQYEDPIVRLASSPQRGTHRGTQYASPMPLVKGNFTDVRDIHNWQRKRERIVNFFDVKEGVDGKSHVEFRTFDSSLDEGTIQAQVKLAVGLVSAAKRIAATGGTRRPKEPWGSHKKGVQVSNDDDTASTRSLIDTILRRPEDKAQLAAVFSSTEWSEFSPWSN